MKTFFKKSLSLVLVTFLMLSVLTAQAADVNTVTKNHIISAGEDINEYMNLYIQKDSKCTLNIDISGLKCEEVHAHMFNSNTTVCSGNFVENAPNGCIIFDIIANDIGNMSFTLYLTDNAIFDVEQDADNALKTIVYYVNVFDITPKYESASIKEGEKITFDIVGDIEDELVWSYNSNIIDVQIAENTITVKALNKGESELNIYFTDDIDSFNADEVEPNWSVKINVQSAKLAFFEKLADFFGSIFSGLWQILSAPILFISELFK